MKRIPLTQGKFALVDDEDYVELNQHKWCAYKQGNTFYAARAVNLMHREILGLKRGDGKVTDHIDHDGLNNQRSNIRVCTQQQNMMNKRKRKNNSSKYKGVYFLKTNKWIAQIHFDNKSIHLGLFDDELEAAQAYDKKAIELFREFAKTNINQS